jgi:hypothetical protein
MRFYWLDLNVTAALYRETEDMLTIDKDKEKTLSSTPDGSRSQSFDDLWDVTQSKK